MESTSNSANGDEQSNITKPDDSTTPTTTSVTTKPPTLLTIPAEIRQKILIESFPDVLLDRLDPYFTIIGLECYLKQIDYETNMTYNGWPVFNVPIRECYDCSKRKGLVHHLAENFNLVHSKFREDMVYVETVWWETVLRRLTVVRDGKSINPLSDRSNSLLRLFLCDRRFALGL